MLDRNAIRLLQVWKRSLLGLIGKARRDSGIQGNVELPSPSGVTQDSPLVCYRNNPEYVDATKEHNSRLNLKWRGGWERIIEDDVSITFAKKVPQRDETGFELRQWPRKVCEHDGDDAGLVCGGPPLDLNVPDLWRAYARHSAGHYAMTRVMPVFGPPFPFTNFRLPR